MWEMRYKIMYMMKSVQFQFLGTGVESFKLTTLCHLTHTHTHTHAHTHSGPHLSLN